MCRYIRQTQNENVLYWWIQDVPPWDIFPPFLSEAAGSASGCEWQVTQTRPPRRGEEGSWLEGETGLASLAWISPSWSQTAEWGLVAALSLDRVTHSLISGEVNNSHTLEPQKWNHTALAAYAFQMARLQSKNAFHRLVYLSFMWQFIGVDDNNVNVDVFKLNCWLFERHNDIVTICSVCILKWQTH